VVIDFDWAGVVNIDVYPPFMNTKDISWPTGASTGFPLLHEHDAYWMRLLFNTTTI
jgi:hypothetical protein